MSEPGVTVRVMGARELRRALKKAGENMSELRTAHKNAGLTVANAARGRAPRRTGRLDASVKSKPTTTKARVGSNLVYAAPIHWGWPDRNISPNPWLWSAAKETEATWIADYEREIQAIIRKVET